MVCRLCILFLDPTLRDRDAVYLISRPAFPTGPGETCCIPSAESIREIFFYAFLIYQNK
jgi:hypothetical protein